MNKPVQHSFSTEENLYQIPLLSTQQGIFLADHLSPLDDLYTIAHCVELPKSVDLVLFKKAIEIALKQAQTITARYSTDPSKQFCTLQPDAEIRIEQFDFCHLSPKKAQQRLWDWMPTDRENAKSLNANASYYYRQALFVMHDKVYWYQRYHHIMLDGFSIIQLTKRIIELYQQAQQGQSYTPSPFIDLQQVIQERLQYEQSADFDKDKAFWINYAQELDTPVSLSCQSGFAKTTAKFIKHQLCISPAIQKRIAEIASASKLSTADLMMALSLHYLKKMTDKSSLVVGVPFMRRLGSKALRALLPTVNVLPVQFVVASEDSWISLAQQVKHTLGKIRPHQRYDAEQILRDLKLIDINTRLYGTILNYKAFDQKFMIDGQEILTQHISTGPIDDFEFSFIQQQDQLIIELRADADRYSEHELILHAERILILLEQSLKTPELSCADTQLNTVHENETLSIVGTGPVINHPARYNNILDIFYEQVQRFPNRIAIVSGERDALNSLSFSELAHKINQLTHFLQKRGAKKNTVIAAAIPRSVDSVVVMLSVLNSGASFLPLDLDYPVERMQMMCEDAHPLFILTTHQISAQLPPNIAQIPLDDVNIQKDLQSQNATEIPKSSRQFEFEDVAYVIFTSGSTGRPKGVMNTHGSLLNLILSHQHTIYWPVLDSVNARFPDRPLRAAHTHSFSFDSSWLQVFWMLWGQELHIFDENMRRDAYGLVQEIQKRQIDTLDLPPSFCAQMMTNGLFAEGQHHPSLILIGGEAAPLALWQQLNAQANLFAHNLYGPTEYTVDTFRAELKKTSRPVIGNPIGNTQAYVLDRQLKICPTGVIGELYISGYGIANGYLGRADLSATRFVANPFQNGQRMYRTGDLVRWNMDGQLEFMGRCDDQIKIRGYRVEIGEVENAISILDHVESAVVIAEPINNSHRLLGYCVVKDIPLSPEKSQELSEQYLAILHHNLPDYMVPTALTVMQEFPRNVSGKVDKKALPRPQIKAKSRPPQTLEQRLICQLAAQILKLAHIGIDDDFFMTGGDSISAIMLCTALRDQGYHLKPSDVFQYKTIENMSRYLEKYTDTTQQFYPWQKYALDYFGDELIEKVQHDYADNTVIVPLLPLQKGMLYHAQTDQTAQYSAFTRISLSAEVDPIQLQTALTHVLKRYPQLTGYFNSELYVEPVLIYQAHPQQPWPVEWLNVKAIDLEEQINTLINTPLNLSEAYGLIRAVLVQSELGHNELIIMIHHLMTDGWSTPLFLNDLVESFKATYNGVEASLQPLNHSYADVVYALLNRNLESSREVWRKTLSAVEPLQLFETISIQPVTEHAWTLDHLLSTKLQQKLRQHGITLNVFMQMMWAMTLQTFAGRDDILFGTPIAGRSAAISGLSDQIGLFLNTIPVRVKLDMYSSIWTQLTDLQCQHSVLLEHDGLGLAEIQEISGHNSLFDTLLVVENYPEQHNQTSKLGTASIQNVLNRGYSHYPLALLVIPNQSIQLLLEQRGVITEPEHFLQRFEQFIRIAIDTPNTLLCHYTVLLENEFQQLNSINSTYIDVAKTTLQCLLRKQSFLYAEKQALIDDQYQLSYQEVREQVCALAQQFHKLGVKPGDIIAVVLPRSVRLSIAILAVIEAGAAYLPIDLSLPEQRIAFMLSDAQPKIVLTETGISLTQTAFETSSHTPIRYDYDALVKADHIDLEHYRTQIIGPDHPAYMIYTSGTTGQPKGVLVSHQAIVNRILWMQNQYPIDETDTILQKTPCGFDVSVWEFFWSYLSGARLAIAPVNAHQDPMALLQCIEKYQVTTLHFVPSMLAIFDHYLVNLLTQEQRESLSLSRIFCSGEALPTTLAQNIYAHFACELHNLYGPTEAAVDVSYANAQQWDQNESSLHIGQPIWNTQLYILDQYLRPLPVGVEGELYLAGDQLAIGYLNRSDLTATRFVANPFMHGKRMYRTGDIARWRADGTVQYIGRTDDQLKIRGQRIELGEIEQHIRQITGLDDVVVLARTLNQTSQDPVLIAYLKSDHSEYDHGRLEQQLMQVLPHYMVPKHYIVLASLPLSHNGKLDRKALPVPIFETETVTGELPRTETEQVLCDIFNLVLNTSQQYDIDQDFFALGGHSILVMKLAIEIRKVFKRQLMMAQLMSNVTIRRLAGFIQTPERLAKMHDLHMQDVLNIRSGTGHPIFCFCPGSGSAWQYTALSRYLDDKLPIIGLQSPRPNGLLAKSSNMEELISRQLKVIQDIQAHGPYTFIGYSLGGTVAYGVAAKLKALGQHVEFLGLIDTYPAEIHQWAENADQDQDLAEEQLQFFDALLEDVDAGFNQETQQLKADIDANYADAVRLLKPYRMPHYEGQLHVFVAEKGLLSYIQPQKQWQPLVRNLCLHSVKTASHTTILSPEQLQIIGPQLNQLIQRSRRVTTVEQSS